VLQDFLAHVRPFAPDADAFDAFARQWFHEVVLPEYELTEIERADLGGGRWRVTGTLTNKGTGTMPVELCAARGERFSAKPAAASDGDVQAEEPAETYAEERTTQALGAGEKAAFTLECPFEPERVLVDPDVLVLQLQRRRAVHEF
jgi:hypothetical protein